MNVWGQGERWDCTRSASCRVRASRGLAAVALMKAEQRGEATATSNAVVGLPLLSSLF